MCIKGTLSCSLECPLYTGLTVRYIVALECFIVTCNGKDDLLGT